MVPVSRLLKLLSIELGVSDDTLLRYSFVPEGSISACELLSIIECEKIISRIQGGLFTVVKSELK